MTDFYTIRCPVCLLEMSVPNTTSVHEPLQCTGCGSAFEFQNALPAAREPTTPLLDNATIVDRYATQRTQLILLSIPLLLVFLIPAGLYSNALDGHAITHKSGNSGQSRGYVAHLELLPGTPATADQALAAIWSIGCERCG